MPSKFLDEREIDVVLIALRYLQDDLENLGDQTGERVSGMMDDLDMDADVPSSDELNQLCIRLNTESSYQGYSIVIVQRGNISGVQVFRPFEDKPMMECLGKSDGKHMDRVRECVDRDLESRRKTAQEEYEHPEVL